MVQVEHVEAHVRRNNGAQATVTCIAQQANTVISKELLLMRGRQLIHPGVSVRSRGLLIER